MSVGRDPFTTHTVGEVRSLLRTMEADVDGKASELQALVSHRYTDLLAAADAVLAMRSLSASLVSGTASALSTAEELLSSAVKSPTPAAPRRATQSTLLSVAGMLSVVLATPELVWGALEVHDFAAAVSAYVLAENIHSALTNTPEYAERIHAEFPVLPGAWDSISAFPSIIQAAAHDALQDLPLGSLLEPHHNAGLWRDEAVSALASHAVLARASLLDTLDHLLASRGSVAQRMLSELLDAADAAPEGVGIPSHAVLAGLAGVALLIDDTLRLAHAVFGDVDAPLSSLLALFEPQIDAHVFHARAQAILSAAPGRPASVRTLPDHLQNFARSESPVWSQSPVAMDDIRARVSAWVASMATVMRDVGGELLDEIKTGADLAAALAGLWAVIDAISHGTHTSLAHSPLLPQAVKDLLEAQFGLLSAAASLSHQASSSSPSSSSSSSSLDTSRKPSALANLVSLDEPERAPAQAWNPLVSLIAGRIIDLWGEVFAPAFAQRSESLIHSAFGQLDLVAVLQQTTSSGAGGDGVGTPFAVLEQWAPSRGSAGNEQVLSLEDLTTSLRKAGCGATDGVTLGGLDAFDAIIAAGVNTALDVAFPPNLSGLDLIPHVHANQTIPAVLSTLASAAQKSLLSAIDSVEGWMGQDEERGKGVLTLLRAIDLGSNELPRLWQVLNLGEGIGRGAQAAYAQSAIAALREPASSKVAAGPNGALRAAAHRRNRASSLGATWSSRVYARMRAVQASACAVYASRLAGGVQAAIGSELGKDDLEGRARKDLWPPHPEARLPAFPSAYVMTALMDLSCQLEELGGSSLHRNAMLNATSATEAAVAQLYLDTMGSMGSRVSDVAACQLLFDVHYLRSVLASQTVLSASVTSTNWAQVVGILESAIDPVDLVVFAPRLAENVSLTFDQTAVMLGNLVQYAQVGRSSAAARGAASSGDGGASAVPLVSVPPRITELAVAHPPSLRL